MRGERRYAYQCRQWSKAVRNRQTLASTKWCENCLRRSRRMRLIEHDYFECEINRARGMIVTMLAVETSYEEIASILTDRFSNAYYLLGRSIRRMPASYIVWTF